MKAIRLPCSSF